MRFASRQRGATLLACRVLSDDRSMMYAHKTHTHVCRLTLPARTQDPTRLTPQRFHEERASESARRGKCCTPVRYKRSHAQAHASKCEGGDDDTGDPHLHACSDTAEDLYWRRWVTSHKMHWSAVNFPRVGWLLDTARWREVGDDVLVVYVYGYQMSVFGEDMSAFKFNLCSSRE